MYACVKLNRKREVNKTEPDQMATVSAVGELVEGFFPLFYLKTPATSSFKEVSEVPNYVQEVTPEFFVLILIEAAVRWLQGKPIPRVNDSISSITAGVMMQITSALTGAFEILVYIWVYKKFHIVELPWDSPITWWVALFAVDFGYYWFHRMAHEINIFWMAHQVHHSSEEYNLTTALRQSLLQRFTSWFFYLPFALAVPPTAYIVHKQFNLLYQFWIHTEVVNTLGPLEWVLNTPSHHRVHHGRNPYCIDKNYAGVLIIWDRMFGTFAPESDKVIYGLVHPLNSWNPLWAQFHHFIYIVTKFGSQKGWKNKISFLLKGPGWSPGKPRLGDIKDIPKVSPDEKPYDTYTPRWLNFYCVIHFLILVAFTHMIGKIRNMLPFFTFLGAVLYTVYSLTNFGLMFECRTVSIPLEVVRLVIFIVVEVLLAVELGLSWVVTFSFNALMCFSIVLWTLVGVKYILKLKRT